MIVCLYCVVFFFKQKTAYEMRISDWSSDVCSSDLFEITLACAASAHRRLLLSYFQELVEQAITAGQLAAAALSTSSVATGTGASGEIEEIGRASCRERVCQYV